MKTKIVVCITLISSVLNAMPSGFREVSPDVTIPSVKGETLPVRLIGDDNPNSKVVWVKPMKGVFESQGVVKSPLADCSLVKNAVEVERLSSQTDVMLAKRLKQQSADLDKQHAELSKVVSAGEVLKKQVALAKEQLEELKASSAELVTELSELRITKENVSTKVALATEETEKLELAKQIKDLNAEEHEIKAGILRASDEISKKSKEYFALKRSFNALDGKISGVSEQFDFIVAQQKKISDQLKAVTESSSAAIKKHSERVGAYTTYYAEFAPASYLQKLKEANPKYQFQYVTSASATVDSTVPGNLKSDSPVAEGTLILDAKWSSALRSREKHPFTNYLIDRLKQAPTQNGVVVDPVAVAQTAIPSLEDSLDGSKFLSLQLSVLGYCALREPHELKEEFVNGDAQAFSLSLSYTYPELYEMEVNGTYNAYSMLYEAYKRSSSSSWFGLSKKEKQEHIRDIINTKDMDISVVPRGKSLTLNETIALAEKTKEEVLKMVLGPHMQVDGKVESLQPLPLPEPTKYSSMAVFRLPHPFFRWSGIFLGTLNAMFGSVSSENIRKFSEKTTVGLNYKLGFTFLIPGQLTIGDLKTASLKDKE